MNNTKLSSRIATKCTLKHNHAPLIQELREASRRYHGGVTGVSNHTNVCPNTLCNQLNINHDGGDVKASTLVDLLFTFKNDTRFVDFFIRYIFEMNEGTHEEACPADLLQTISKASELIHMSTAALVDGEISNSEAGDLIDLSLHVIKKLQSLVEKLRTSRGDI